MQAAKGKAPPPPELVAAWWCDRYRTPPRAAGLYDQGYHEMYLMSVLPNIYSAVQDWRQHPTQMNEDAGQTIAWLVKIGAMA